MFHCYVRSTPDRTGVNCLPQAFLAYNTYWTEIKWFYLNIECNIFSLISKTVKKIPKFRIDVYISRNSKAAEISITLVSLATSTKNVGLKKPTDSIRFLIPAYPANKTKEHSRLWGWSALESSRGLPKHCLNGQRYGANVLFEIFFSPSIGGQKIWRP